MTREKPNEDKIVEEYLSGQLPFSEIYSRVTKGEECPDDLSTRILAMAAGRDRARTARWTAVRFSRRTRIVVEAALLAAAAAALIVAISMPPRTPSLECPGNTAAEKNGPDSAPEMPELNR